MAAMPDRRPLLRETAYGTLRDAIVRGDIAPGEPVRDGELAHRFDLSRAPVRDALSRLGHEGLVETRPQSYTRVTSVVPREVRDAATVVRVLLQLAAHRAVAALSEAEIAAMGRARQQFADAAERGQVEEALRADEALHGVLLDACGNRAASTAVQRCTPLIRRLQLLRPEEAVAGGPRDELVDACAGGRGDAAAEHIAALWRPWEELPDDLRFR